MLWSKWSLKLRVIMYGSLHDKQSAEMSTQSHMHRALHTPHTAAEFCKSHRKNYIKKRRHCLNISRDNILVCGLIE